MGKTILIVDDTSAIVEYIKDVLSTINSFFKFITATNGYEAYKLAVNDKPDVIIMDWDMPLMNGLETLIRIKRNTKTKDIPVIITTVNADQDKLRSLTDNKVFSYIKKPIINHELTTKFNNALILSNALKQLKTEKQKLLIEKQKTDSILRAILPGKIIHDIKKTGYSSPRKYKNTVVIFIDLVNFTQKTQTMSPRRLIKELNELYSAYDEIITKHNCTRIKTVGDAYVATSGLPTPNKDAVLNAIEAALEIRNFLINRNLSNSVKWEIRTGLYYGDVIGSLVSMTNSAFDIFGHTVNMAARFQSACDPMQINIPESIKNIIKDKYRLIERLPHQVKGQGIMKMYYVHHPISKNVLVPAKEEILTTNKPIISY
ncbi:MAG: adenylate/guanylate cyclase domain-containing response regulator [Chlorobi bacterium]|nr:adenylate/guanylate cyclase domain-containing response regulator [Chlorobiota bacterium]